MKKILLSTVLCASVMLAANSDYKYEITPMIGGTYTEGNLDLERNYMNAGLALGFNQTNSVFDQIELGFLRSVEDVEYNAIGQDTGVTRVFTNFIKDYPLNSNMSFYALVGAGLEFFDDESYGNEDGLFGNYGLGIKHKITENISLKADLRHLIETDHGDNNLLYNIGLSIPFGKVAKMAPEPKDQDNDGVIDVKDNCPYTPAGVAVDTKGCELDSDNDGVVDRLDKCPNTMAGAKVDSVGCMTVVDLSIQFDTNSAKIKEGYDAKIIAFANMMKDNKHLKATINAYTDSVGKEAYNKTLSEKRAQSTVNKLTALNVEASRLKAVGFGEENPVASNDTVEGRTENRRVTAVISK